MTDIDSLVAVLAISLDEKNGWDAYLEEFITYSKREKDRIEKSMVLTNISFFFDQFTIISEKVMNLLQLNISQKKTALRFLDFALNTVLFFLEKLRMVQVMPALISLLSPEMPIYLYNGRETNSQYSSLLVGICDSFLEKGGILIFLDIISSGILVFDEYYSIFTAIKKINYIKGNYTVFELISSKSISSFNIFLSATFVDKDYRRINFQKLLEIITIILNSIRDQSIVVSLFEDMIELVLYDVAEVTLSGYRLCAILYTESPPKSLKQSNYFLDSLDFLVQRIDSIEKLQVLTPIMVKLSKERIINNLIIKDLFEISLNQHASIFGRFIENTIEIFGVIPDISHLTSLLNDNPVYEYLSRLILLPQYSSEVLKIIWKEITHLNNVDKYFSLLIRNVGFLEMNLYFQRIQSFVMINHEFISYALELLKNLINSDNICELNSQDIIEIVLNQYSNTEDRNKVQIISNLFDILKKSLHIINEQEFLILFDLSSSDVITHLIRTVFPLNEIVAISDISQVALNIIFQRLSSDLSSFSVFKYFYNNVNQIMFPNHQLSETLQKMISEHLVFIIFHVNDESLWNQATDLFIESSLSLSNFGSMNYYFALSCDEISRNQNINASKFILKSIRYLNSKIYFQHDHHKYLFPSDLVSIRFVFNSITFEKSFESSLSVCEILPHVSNQISEELNSIVFYVNGKNVDLQCPIIHYQGTTIEIRIKKVYPKNPSYDLSIHPILTLENVFTFQQIQHFLKSPFGKDMYCVLLQLKTPPVKDMFSQTILNNLDYPYYLAYYVHHLGRNRHKSLIEELQRSLIESFHCFLPEVRCHSIELLDSTFIDSNMISVLIKLVSLDTYYDKKALGCLIDLMHDKTFSIDLQVLCILVFEKEYEYKEKLLKSKLIQSQPFSLIWDGFNSHVDYVKHIEVISWFCIPETYFSVVYEKCIELVMSKQTGLFKVFSQIVKKWDQFPLEKLANFLINNYIESFYDYPNIDIPLELLNLIIQKDPKLLDKVAYIVTRSMPLISQWSYDPKSLLRDTSDINCGLSNLGATCFINSVLQQLNGIPIFRDYVINTSIEHSFCNLKSLFLFMMYSKRKFIQMDSFIEQWVGFDGNKINPREQQDANEFIIFLITKLGEISNEFTGKIKHIFQGIDCSYAHEINDSFTTLSLEVSDLKNMKESLALFSHPEIIDEYRSSDSKEPFRVNHVTEIISTPDNLIIQLKRFSYSIQTGERIKIDQHYEFDDEILLCGKDYSLNGVIVHQGDGYGGHYYSYIRKKFDGKWICYNDSGVYPVSDIQMKNDCFGKSESGSSAYLLFYSTKTTPIEFSIGIGIKNEYEKVCHDNNHLLKDCVYLSDSFSQFIRDSIITHNLDSALDFFFRILVKGTNVNQVRAFSERLIDFINISSTNLDLMRNYLQNNIVVVLDTLCMCSNQGIRDETLNFVSSFISKDSHDSDFGVFFLATLNDMIPQVLNYWRNGFDAFHLLYDFISNDENNKEIAFSMGIINQINDFIIRLIPNYIKQKDHKGIKVPIDRFKRVSDFSYIIKILDLYPVYSEMLLTNDYIKWFISSEKSVDSLIECLFKHKLISRSVQIIEKSGVVPTEELTVALLKTKQVSIPSSWFISGFFSVSEAQIRICRYLACQSEFPGLLLQNDTLTISFLFSEHQQVREAIFQSIMNRFDNSDLKSIYKHFANVVTISRRIYSKNNMSNAIPAEYFHGLEYLNFVLMTLPESKCIHEAFPSIVLSLEQTIQIGGKYDRHLPIILRILSYIVFNGSIISDKSLIISLYKSAQYIANDHSDYDGICSTVYETIRNLNVINNYSSEIILPDNDVIFLLFSNMTSTNPRLDSTKESALNLCLNISKRYAIASKLIKMFVPFIEKTQNFDMNSVYKTLFVFPADLIDNNIALISGNEKFIKHLVSRINIILSDVDMIQRIISIISCLISKGVNIARVVYSETTPYIEGILTIIANPSIMESTKAICLKLLKEIIATGNYNAIRQYGSFVCSRYIHDISIDSYISSLFSFLKSIDPKSQLHSQLQVILSREFIESFNYINSLCERPSVLSSLETDVFLNNLFIEKIAESNVLLRIWTFNYDESVNYKGIVLLTKYVFGSKKSNDLKQKILQIDSRVINKFSELNEYLK